jgi:uncharacterized protein YukJ
MTNDQLEALADVHLNNLPCSGKEWSEGGGWQDHMLINAYETAFRAAVTAMLSTTQERHYTNAAHLRDMLFEKYGSLQSAVEP